jgi:hypothetical protein
MGRTIAEIAGSAKLAPGAAVEGVHHQYGVAGLREALAHGSEGRTQAEDVRPDDHGGMTAGSGVYKVAVGDAVRGSDVNIHLHDVLGIGHGGQHQCHGGTGAQFRELATVHLRGKGQIGFVFFYGMVVTHSCCSPESGLRGRQCR